MNHVPPFTSTDLTSSVLIHFTDGTITDVANLANAARGRHIDQIVKVELYPDGGGRIDGERDGKPIRGESFNLPDLPFHVVVILPLEVAQKIGTDLSGPAIWLPPA